MGLGALGGLYNGYQQYQNQKNAIAARNAAAQAELARQHKYQADASKVFDTTMAGFQPGAQAQALTDAQAGTNKVLTGNDPLNLGGIGTRAVDAAPGGAAANPVVANAAAHKVADVFARGTARDNALADLTGWNQRQFDNGLNLAGSGRNLSVISDLSKVSAGVGNMEEQAAYANAQRTPNALGDLLMFAGKVGGYGGAKGWWNPAPTAAAAAPGAATVPWGPQAPFNNYGGVGWYGA